MEPQYFFCPLCGRGLDRDMIEGKQRGVCRACGWVDYKNPLPVAVALAHDGRGRVLVIKRGIEPSKGKWSLPGGFIESGESPRDACLRELFEETGVRGVITALRGVFDRQSPGYGAVLVVCYEVEAHETALSPHPQEIEEARFCGEEDMPVLYSPVYRTLVSDFFHRRRLS